MKQTRLWRVVVACFAVMMLFGCGADKEIDHYMEGYNAVKAKDYEAALESFRLAAEEGDSQAATAAEIISGYFHARDAAQLGDYESAKAFLKDLPDNYKYYAIGEDIDSLRRRVYAATAEEAPPTETPAPPKVVVTENPWKLDKDRQLKEIEEWLSAGELEMAEAALSDLVNSDLTAEQQNRWEQASQRLQELREAVEDEPLSPEKATEYLRAAYPEVEGDLSSALVPRYDEEGDGSTML